MRYVERNPVRAGMTRPAEDYRWAHCGLRRDSVLSANPRWGTLIAEIRDWPQWLEDDEPADRLESLRKHTDQGLCGPQYFVSRIWRR